MNVTKRALAAVLTVALAPVALASDDAPWIADYDEAAALAKREGKDLLVDFTGSDWCGWCIRLDEEVFAHEEFLTAATEDFVLVALDFPRGDEAKARIPNPERNRELQAKWGITGFPTILLVTADGDLYGRTGYRAGGPVAYVEHLDELRTEGREAVMKAKKMVVAFEEATGAAKMKQLEEILTTMEGLSEGSPVADMLSGPARHALEADPMNKKGLKLRATKALLGAGKTDADLIEAAIELDPKNAEGLFEKAALARFQALASEADVKPFCELLGRLLDAPNEISDVELKRVMTVNAAFWAEAIVQDMDMAKRFARVALDTGLADEEDTGELVEKLQGIVNG